MLRKVIYMLLGGVLTLALVFGAYATFAQTDDGETAVDESSESGTTTPWRYQAPRGQRGFMWAQGNIVNGQELLAEALGITVDELQAAQSAVRAILLEEAVALLEEAVADGLITQEQADQLQASPGLRGRHVLRALYGADYVALLAEELGISQEALQTAMDEAKAERLAALVEAGVITQEQADMMAAYREVQGYVDYDALNESVKSIFSAAIEQALADGVITQAQADQMQETLANLNMHGFPGGRMMPGMGGHRHGGRGWFEGFGSGSGSVPAPVLEGSGT